MESGIKLTVKTLRDRISLARRVIINLRMKHGRNHERGIAYGAIGLLDFIESGDPSKIMHLDMRQEIKKILLQERGTS